MRLGDILRQAARRTPRKIAIVAGDRELGFADCDAAADRFANALIAAGIAAGDRIATVLFNTPEYCIAHFGNARAGSVLVHVSPMYAAPEIARILERTRPRLVVVDAAVAEKVADIRDRVESVETIVVVGAPAPAGTISFEDFAARGSPTPPPVEVDPSRPVAMTFTGGTTGEPKGAVVTHDARYVSAWTTALEHRVSGADVCGVLTPMFHAVGLMIWYQATLLAGATAVLFRRWDPGHFIAETDRRRLSSVFMVPVQVRDLMNSPDFDAGRLASLANIGAGGALTPDGLIDELKRVLPHCDYTDHYGQSETGPLTILKPWEAAGRGGSIGRPAVGVDLRVVDPSGNDVPPGEPGEMIVRGQFMMEGYYEDPVETAAYFRGGDGWGWTGDLAVRDEDGFLTLVGRSKEMIVSGGINVYPREIERVLERHPAVEDCTAFGVPDPRWDEALVVYVVRRPGAEIDGEALIAHCGAKLARYKRPREIVFVDRIPKTPSGKVQKPLLRAAYLEGRILP